MSLAGYQKMSHSCTRMMRVARPFSSSSSSSLNFPIRRCLLSPTSISTTTLQRGGLPRMNKNITTLRTTTTGGKRHLGTAAAVSTKTTTTTKATKSPPLKHQILSAILKYSRMPALIFTVGGLGYQMGIMDTINDPAKKEQSLLEQVCRSAGCSDPKDGTKTRMVKDSKLSHLMSKASLERNDPDLYRVASVGKRIVKVAQCLSKQEREKEIKQIKNSGRLPISMSSNPDIVDQIVQLNPSDPLAGASNVMEGGEWTYILLDSPAPNAFVTSILPRKIFVTTAMMDQLVDNDDEMAMILGHEVSHLLLGHVKNRTIIEAVLSTTEIVILSTLSAAGGFGTLYAMSMIASIKRWTSNAYSRESEKEADQLGIKLAAMSSFDTKRGIEVFKKMAKLDPPGVKFMTIELDHPPTEERYNYLLEASKEENASKYNQKSR